MFENSTYINCCRRKICSHSQKITFNDNLTFTTVGHNAAVRDKWFIFLLDNTRFYIHIGRKIQHRKRH